MSKFKKEINIFMEPTPQTKQKIESIIDSFNKKYGDHITICKYRADDENIVVKKKSYILFYQEDANKHLINIYCKPYEKIYFEKLLDKRKESFLFLDNTVNV